MTNVMDHARELIALSEAATPAPNGWSPGRAMTPEESRAMWQAVYAKEERAKAREVAAALLVAVEALTVVRQCKVGHGICGVCRNRIAAMFRELGIEVGDD